MNRLIELQETPVRRRAIDGICEIDLVDSSKVAAAKNCLPPEQLLQRCSEAFKILAHPSRLRILKALDGRELCVCDISQVLGITMSGTSQQLRDLRNLGAIEYRPAGKLAYYTLADRFWLDLAESVLERYGAAHASKSKSEKLTRK